MERAVFSEVVVAGDSNSSGVSWSAVIAGAFAAASLSLALLALGTGVGLSSVSLWANSGASASSIRWTAIIWLVLMEIIASSMGGYLAGRLRTRWVNVHTHEVYFRDTAHGFLVRAVGLVITAAFLTSTAASMVGRGTTRGTEGESSQARQTLNQAGYFVDTLLRTSSGGAMQDSSSLRTEFGLIVAKDIQQGGLPQAHKSYLAEVIAARAGVSEPEAERGGQTMLLGRPSERPIPREKRSRILCTGHFLPCWRALSVPVLPPQPVAGRGSSSRCLMPEFHLTR